MSRSRTMTNTLLCKKKYETTFAEVENQILETEVTLSAIIDELEGNLQKYVSGSNIDHLISKDRIMWIHTPDFMKIYNEVIDDLYGNEKISKQLKSFFIDDED